MDNASEIRTAAGQIDTVPLVVDLDGTLLRTDTLVEALLAVARLHPMRLLIIPLWLVQGRGRLKRALAESADIDVHTLPVRQELIDALRIEKQRGRHLILATGAAPAAI